jgi:hypothetical protein
VTAHEEAPARVVLLCCAAEEQGFPREELELTGPAGLGEQPEV